MIPDFLQVVPQKKKSPDLQCWPSLDPNCVFFSFFLLSTVYLLAPPWHEPQKGDPKVFFLNYSVLHAVKQFNLMHYENRVMRLPSNGSQYSSNCGFPAGDNTPPVTTYTLIIPCRHWERDLLRSKCYQLNLRPDSTNPVVSLIDGPGLSWREGAFLDFKLPCHPKNEHACFSLVSFTVNLRICKSAMSF